MIDPSEVADLSVLNRIIEGRFDDPFAVLGPQRKGKLRYVTVFDPGASEMAAMVAGKASPLEPVTGYPGLFHGKVAGAKPYLLRGRRDGEEWLVEDAYRFGPVLGEMDEYLLGEGTHHSIWKVLGAHVTEHEGVRGTHFAVWAPNARRVSVIGDFNAWDGRRHVMRRRGATGVWEIFLPLIGDGTPYKYEILGAYGERHEKADPVGFGSQHPPQTASVVRDVTGYGWSDAEWMASRAKAQRIDQPISIYEVHLGSWRRKDGGRPISYKEAAVELVEYARDMGFTHIELLPVSEYPFDGSWGYQPVGLFAPTIRFGPPHEFRDLVNAAHKAGLGVLLDWVPGHFPTDAHGLGRFDGTALYEHSDPREGFHQDWNTLIYNYGRTEVMNFLTSNGLYWLQEYHVDGLRVDAVASMLYRDYSRSEGQWVPNKDGGRENYEAIAMLQEMNRLTYGEAPGIMTVAEESTSYPKVSRPVHDGGLGFGFKWNMGWMNDTLNYIIRDPVYRSHHHHQMTFGLHYAFSENFILPISHDEVVHGKGSMLAKMPGEGWDKFANLRAYYGFMWGHPGKKLLFMGQEFAQGAEWNHDAEIDWACLGNPLHYGMQGLVRDLNRLYAATPALYARDCDGVGFQWIEANDADHSVYAWIRRGAPGDPEVVVACNFT
ncbi:MAG TPA: 1,4-alpha-glucan branching protein GlgB, partial [Paracoccus sp. (in: a-proteobacteria)]|nr:1,4-alpha-glucan branching protein GlgB [Paracoccus sp. (in: a-proteobacteria)]